jgi:hypothetical protein
LENTYQTLMPHLFNTYPDLFDKDTHTVETLTWSAMMVWSRAFGLGDWNTSETGLIPFVDLANHGPKGLRGDTSWDEQTFDLVAGPASLAGDELVISYGDSKPSPSFVLFYGFLPESDFGDFVTLGDPVNFERSDRGGVSGATELLVRAGSPVAAIGPDGYVSDSFIAQCGIQAMAAATRKDKGGGSTKSNRNGDVTSDDTSVWGDSEPGRAAKAKAEAAVDVGAPETLCAGAAKLLRDVKSALHALPTSLAADLQLRALQQSGAATARGNAYNLALSIRIRFKTILHTLLERLVDVGDTCRPMAEPSEGSYLVHNLLDSDVLLEGHVTISLALFHVGTNCEA